MKDWQFGVIIGLSFIILASTLRQPWLRNTFATFGGLVCILGALIFFLSSRK
jgi:hypothetical protein